MPRACKTDKLVNPHTHSNTAGSKNSKPKYDLTVHNVAPQAGSKNSNPEHDLTVHNVAPGPLCGTASPWRQL